MPYSIKTKKNDAKACGVNLRISYKNAIPICRTLRGMRADKAKVLLQGMVEGTRTFDGKHSRKNISKQILNLIKSAESNAEDKGVDTKNLYIFHIAAQKGRKIFRPTAMRFKTGPWQMKNAHIEVVLREGKPIRLSAKK